MDREPRIGECVVVVRNGGRHDQQPGQLLTIYHVDSDDETVRAFPGGAKVAVDGWIPWADLEPVRFGWDFIREHLPPDVSTALGACTGIEATGLNRDVKLAIIASLPDLKQRVEAAALAVEADGVE